MTNVIVERVNVFPQEFLEFKFSTELITPLVKAVQELTKKVEELEAKISGSI